MIGIKVDNLSEVERDLTNLDKNIGTGTQRTLGEVGFFVQAEAKQRCPVSPTKAQAAGTGYHYDPKKSPNELANSIDRKLGRGYVDVGVIHGNATKYAAVIHDGRGKSWNKLGPGSKAKGNLVGEKFIDRAYDDNKREIDKQFEDGVNAEVRRFNDGN